MGRGRFMCGTFWMKGRDNVQFDRNTRSVICYEFQLAQQADQIASLELSLASFQEHHEAQTMDWENKVAQQAELLREALPLIKELAECRCCEMSDTAQALISKSELALERIK